MKKIIGMGLLVVGIIISGCSKSPQVEILKTANEKGFCIQNKLPISEIAELSRKTFEKEVVYDGSKCKDYKIDFKQRTCFHSLDELQHYVDAHTNYNFLINSQNVKGIEIANISVYDAIDYLNSRGYKKEIIFVDGDMKLENRYGSFIKSMTDLKDYVAETTPMYFKKIQNTPFKTVYALRYKKTGKKINDIKGISTNLQEAKILTLKIEDMNTEKKEKIIKKINEIMIGVINEKNN